MVVFQRLVNYCSNFSRNVKPSESATESLSMFLWMLIFRGSLCIMADETVLSCTHMLNSEKYFHVFTGHLCFIFFTVNNSVIYLNWFASFLHTLCTLNFQISINSSVMNLNFQELLSYWFRPWKENHFTWCPCSPELYMCHRRDPGLPRAPWPWCSQDLLYCVSVLVLCLCPHSLLCEFFEQLIASSKKIKTQRGPVRWLSR